MKHNLVITESQYEVLLNILNEQKKSLTLGGQKIHIGGKGTDVSKISQKDGNYTVTIPETEWDSYIAKYEPKLYKSWGSKTGKSAIYWGEIKKRDKKFAVGILEAFVNGGYTGCVITKKGEPAIEPKKTDDSGELKYPSLVYNLPASVPPNSNFFVDNEWVLTDVFKQMVENDIVSVISTNVNQIIQRFPEAKDRPNVYLRGLSIDTSCSTLPNGVPKLSPGSEKYSKGISFVQLSTERNNAAKEYVINRLKQLNVGIDDKTIITQNPNGTNTGVLLGTSGPTWNSKLSNVEKNKLRPKYEQYKYAKINLDLQFNVYETLPEVRTGDTQTDKVITDVLYDVKLTKRKGFNINIPKVTLKIGKNKGFKGSRSLDCEFFGGKGSSKGKWWDDPKLGYK